MKLEVILISSQNSGFFRKYVLLCLWNLRGSFPFKLGHLSKWRKNQNLLLHFSQAFQEIPKLLKRYDCFSERKFEEKGVVVTSRPFDFKIVSIPLYFAFPEKLGSGMLLCAGLHVQTFQKELIQLCPSSLFSSSPPSFLKFLHTLTFSWAFTEDFFFDPKHHSAIEVLQSILC